MIKRLINKGEPIPFPRTGEDEEDSPYSGWGFGEYQGFHFPSRIRHKRLSGRELRDYRERVARHNQEVKKCWKTAHLAHVGEGIIKRDDCQICVGRAWGLSPMELRPTKPIRKPLKNNP